VEPAGLVRRDELSIDYGLVDVEPPTNLVGECIETSHRVAVSRDEAAAALLKVAQGAKAIVLEVKEPPGVVERPLSPGRDDRLHPRKCHAVLIWARPADFIRTIRRTRATVTPVASAIEFQEAPWVGAR
jgi:hypothetical protein